MERINFREVNKKLNELKQAEDDIKWNYFFAELGSDIEDLYFLELNLIREDLQTFRNKKINSGL